MQETAQTIVVVDDDAGMNQAIERLLDAAGFKSVTFPSAEALVESGVANRAACLILDIHLPGLSGFDLEQQLTQGGYKLPVIFITAFDDPESHRRAATAGAIAYLTKPFSGKKLVAAVAQALGPNRSRKNHTAP